VKYEGSVQNINTKFNIIFGKITFLSWMQLMSFLTVR